ncbi:putative uncharacterized protein [Eubacterium sp. CAG:76]|jgi:regulator of protease activity HflC (stomatin/prohibitin superfamily)|nr:putative uncharacterized protein [Eubacterium sp. CAG:76]
MESEKMELRLINPNESGFLQHIEWNSEEIRKQVQMMMSAYTDVVYTEDTMKAAKDDRATLNKFKKVIEDRRKEVKKKCMEPYEQFEKEVKEITALIDKPIGMIDSQIKEYEERQKAEKKSQIQAAYDESIGEFVNDLPFERVFDTRYLNATFSLSKAMSEVIEKIEKFKTDIATIDSLDSKHKLNVRDVYVRTLDLSQAMAEDRRLRELEERLEADRKAKEEAERKRQEAETAKREEAERQRAEAERIAAEQKAAAKAQPVSEMGRAIASIEHQAFSQAVQAAPEEKREAPAQVPEKQSEPEAEVKRYKATFWCKGTLEQIKALGDYMRANNIEFGKVAK